MTETAKRATVYFKSDLDNAIRQKALRTHRTISDVVNDAVRMYLREDQKDLAAFADRRGQLSITYEALLKNLKKHGKL